MVTFRCVIFRFFKFFFIPLLLFAFLNFSVFATIVQVTPFHDAFSFQKVVYTNRAYGTSTTVFSANATYGSNEVTSRPGSTVLSFSASGTASIVDYVATFTAKTTFDISMYSNANLLISFWVYRMYEGESVVSPSSYSSQLTIIYSDSSVSYATSTPSLSGSYIKYSFSIPLDSANPISKLELSWTLSQTQSLQYDTVQLLSNIQIDDLSFEDKLNDINSGIDDINGAIHGSADTSKLPEVDSFESDLNQIEDIASTYGSLDLDQWSTYVDLFDRYLLELYEGFTFSLTILNNVIDHRPFMIMLLFVLMFGSLTFLLRIRR